MSEAAETVPSRVIISDISPAPDAATLVAITIALEQGWPQPAVDVASSGPSEHKSRWRFSQRRWQHRAVPMQTWGRQR